MKPQHHSRLKILLGVCSLATLVLILGPGTALSACQVRDQVTLTLEPDNDCDGFSNAMESGTGVTLDIGTAAQVTFPPCVAGSNRSLCVDENDPDVFIVVQPASPSKFPANLLECVGKPVAIGGLEIATHFLESNQVGAISFRVTTRSVQKAFFLREGTDSDGTVYGISDRVGPNGGLEIEVFPLKIETFLIELYGDLQSIPAGKFDGWVNEVACHEFGHVAGLTSACDKRFDCFHYKEGSLTFLEENVKVIKKGSKITINFADGYAPGDAGSVCLNKFDDFGNCETVVE